MASDPSRDREEAPEPADRTHLVFAGFLLWFVLVFAALLLFGLLANRSSVKDVNSPRLNSPVIVAPPEGANRGQ